MLIVSFNIFVFIFKFILRRRDTDSVSNPNWTLMTGFPPTIISANENDTIGKLNLFKANILQKYNGK